MTGLPRLPLSIKASTASWSILFSFLTIISGAPSSKSLFNLLFLLITRLYKSFKSEVAKRPPSSSTIGLKSGGMTGSASRIIHSGLLPLSLKASTTSRRLVILTLFCPVAPTSSSLSSFEIFSGSTSIKSSLIASAPIPALNPPGNFFEYSSYSCSVKSSCLTRFVSPGSSTT